VAEGSARPGIVTDDERLDELADRAKERFTELLRDPSFVVSGIDVVNLSRIEMMLEGEPLQRVEIGMPDADDRVERAVHRVLQVAVARHVAERQEEAFAELEQWVAELPPRDEPTSG
jgi:hypothetical protein